MLQQGHPRAVHAKLQDKIAPVRSPVRDDIKSGVKRLRPQRLRRNSLQALQALVIDRLIPQRTLPSVPDKVIGQDGTDGRYQLVEATGGGDEDGAFGVEVLAFAAAETGGPDAVADVDGGADGTGEARLDGRAEGE